MNNKSFLTDARLRGEYRKFLGQQSTNKRNVPGQDYNVAGQARNATLGTQNYRANAKPRMNMGDAYQRVLRNKPNEQGGVATPAKPATAPNMLATRRG